MILIVDDHLDSGAVLARLLKKCGHDAIAVSSGIAALSLLETTRPSVIVLDKEMPDMNGLDVLWNIRHNAAAADIPVIFYSADSDPDSMNEAMRLGAQDYLIKTSTPWEEVCATVGQYAVA